MTDIQMIDELDQKIARLQAARDALAEALGDVPAMQSPVRRFNNRPYVANRGPVAKKAPGQRRQMSPEARAKIAEAQKRRWAGVAADKAAVVAKRVAKKESAPAKGGYRPRGKKNQAAEPVAEVAAAVTEYKGEG